MGHQESSQGHPERPADRLLEVSHAAKRLNVSQDTVRGFIRSGFLPALKLPTGYYRIRESALEEFIKSLEL